MKEEMLKCKHCGAPGQVVTIMGVQYAQCTNCTKWDPYQFVGINNAGAIHRWNIYNSHNKIMEESND